MNIRQWLVVGMIGIVSAGATPLAHAQPEGWYIGGSFGSADDRALDETDEGFKLFGGYRSTKNLAVEFAAVSFGPFISTDRRSEIDKFGIAVEAIGILPIGERFELVGKGGVFLWTVEELLFTTGVRTTDDGTDVTYGLGIQLHFSPILDGRIEWERFGDVGDDDVDLISFGVIYRF